MGKLEIRKKISELRVLGNNKAVSNERICLCDNFVCHREKLLDEKIEALNSFKALFG